MGAVEISEKENNSGRVSSRRRRKQFPTSGVRHQGEQSKGGSVPHIQLHLLSFSPPVLSTGQIPQPGLPERCDLQTGSRTTDLQPPARKVRLDGLPGRRRHRLGLPPPPSGPLAREKAERKESPWKQETQTFQPWIRKRSQVFQRAASTYQGKRGKVCGS